MITITDVTPYDVAWDETTMPVNIGGDPRRCVCLYREAGAGTCNGVYSVWVRKGTAPWVRVGSNITVAGSERGHAIASMEVMNSFTKLYVCRVGAANADRWFVSSSGNTGCY